MHSRCPATVGILLAFAAGVGPIAAAQSVGVRFAGAEVDHDLFATVAGLAATVRIPLPASKVRLVLGLERLAGTSERVGIPCGGLADPTACLPEPLRDHGRVSSFTVGGLATLPWSRRLAFQVGADVGVSEVRSRTRGLDGGLRLRADKTMWRLGGTAELEWSPSLTVPLAIVGGAGLAWLNPFRSSGVVDGYTPFERGATIGQLSIGVLWHLTR